MLILLVGQKTVEHIAAPSLVAHSGVPPYREVVVIVTSLIECSCTFIVGIEMSAFASQPAVAARIARAQLIVPLALLQINASSGRQIAKRASFGMNIGYPEQEFILAEAALRGWTDDDPETHYLNGIRAAHEFLGVSPADTRAYLGHEKVQFKGSDTEKLGKIITEKYLNFFMQGGNEAYFELRRTGYPDFSAYLTHNTDQIYNDGYLPLRYRYPQSEIDNNNAQVSEAIKRLDKGDDRNSRMWLLQGSDPLFNPAPFPFRYKN